MRYQRVCLESLGFVLPEEEVTSEEIELRLAPTYARLRLPPGRLEAMSGIRSRRFFSAQLPVSHWSRLSARRALDASGLNSRDVGALLHGSVCRDFLEPATACRVHDALGLPSDCLVADVSNACLGLLTGAAMIANMIELGQIRAGLVVGTESGRTLVENTIARLNGDLSIDRQAIKRYVASLTIGSASAALLLCDRDLSRTGNLLTTSTVRAFTHQNALCQSEGLDEVMQTDSESLLEAGVEAGATTLEQFLADSGWGRDELDRIICHQVGSAHRKRMYERLQLDPARDYSTLEWLGNTGAAAAPITLALAAATGALAHRQNAAILGIGSGVNCQMLAVRWEQSLVAGDELPAELRRFDAAAGAAPAPLTGRRTEQKTRPLPTT